VDNGLVNAAAFPGRQIVLFRGLIDEAKSPDEIAGVLAHEIGHVEQRHVMAALIRDFGISLVLGGADGGAIAQGLLASRYSRSSESEADDYSMQALTAAHISAEPTAAFFERMGKEESKLGRAAVALSYVASHPLSKQRRQRFRAAAQQQKDTVPAIDDAHWRALKSICAEQKRPPR
jgi:predicted Zn-dependent protease